MPYLVTADAAFFSQRNEQAAQDRGVKRVAIPNRSTKASNASDSGRNAGSATRRNGAPVVKAASVF